MRKQEAQAQLVSAAVEAVRMIIRTLRPVPRVRLLRVSDLPYNSGWRRS